MARTFLGAALTVALASSLLQAPAQGQTLTNELFASGFARPIFMTQAPGDDTRFFVCEQHTGRIRVIEKNAKGQIASGLPAVKRIGVMGKQMKLLG